MKIGNRPNRPCEPGLEWFVANYLDGGEHDEVFRKAVEGGHFDYPAWALAYSMSPAQAARWAIHCARAVLHVFETAYPDKPRPRQSIEAAEAYIANPCHDTQERVLVALKYAEYADEEAMVSASMAAHSACAAAMEALDVTWTSRDEVWPTWNAAWLASRADPSITLDLLREGYRIWKEVMR